VTAPQRVRVTAPRPVRGRTHATRTTGSEIDAQTEIGSVYLRSLMRAHLRLATGSLLLLALTVGGLPVLFLLLPRLAAYDVLGMPLSWGLLGFGCYPVLVLLGWWHVRRAERVERAFADLVEDS
jgi:putative solute:sodium symporter small subunit